MDGGDIQYNNIGDIPHATAHPRVKASKDQGISNYKHQFNKMIMFVLYLNSL
jgi:hypothetical protein